MKIYAAGTPLKCIAEELLMGINGVCICGEIEKCSSEQLCFHYNVLRKRGKFSY